MQLTVLPKRQERGENTKAASQTTGQTTDELVATSSIDLIMAVTNQPGSYAPSDFQTGLFDVCKDCGTCCYGVLCYWCIGWSIASNMNEFFLCGHSTAIRSVYRTKYNIRVSLNGYKKLADYRTQFGQCRKTATLFNIVSKYRKRQRKMSKK
uniref:Placenta associated 8 n=1 Tax=Sander lucioperca TaxID=283035 RepID=A0A8C9XHT5_SANLU